MDQTLSLGWMQAEAKTRLGSYRRLLRLALIAEAVIGLLVLLAPGWISSLLGMQTVPELPAGTVWARAWGATLLMVVLLQVPAMREPVRHRWGNAVGIAGRLLLGVVFLLLGLFASGGMLWLALLELGLGVALAVLYFGLFRAELMSRP